MLICRDLRSGTGCGAQNPDTASICAQCGRSLRYALVLRNPNDRIGRYRVLRLIGHGGFGAVYEVEVVVRPGVRVTLKETFTPDSVTTFEKEFAVLRDLRHDNLPRYFEVFESGGSGFLVMEFVPGQSLEDVLRKQAGPVLEKLVLHYADQLCDVLTYLHSQNPAILHRDVKPANIRLTPEGLIKLVDFGLFKQGTQTTHTERHRAGSLAYAPLEQWTGGTDRRSDVYSLGATLYHLMTGRVPPPAGARSSTMHDPLVAPRELNPRITPVTEAMVLKAMHIDRDMRFATIEEMHNEVVRGAQAGRGTTPLNIPKLAATPDAPLIVQLPSLSEAQSQSCVPIIEMAHSWEAHYDVINALSWSPDGRLLASGSDDGRIRLWQITPSQAPEPLPTFLGGVGKVFAIAWRPDGQVLLSAGRDQVIRQWRANDGTWLGSWAGHVGTVTTLAWAPDGQRVLSGGEDRTLRVWNPVDGRPLVVLPSHIQMVSSVAWGPSGRTLISASSDTTLRLWQSDRWSQITTLRGHSRGVNCVAWSPNGSVIASGSADNTIRLWQGADGFASGVLYGHTDAVLALAWSPNGQMIASVGTDCTLRIWRVTDSTVLYAQDAHRRPITSVSWSPDGRMIATAGADRYIKLWHVG